MGPPRRPCALFIEALALFGSALFATSGCGGGSNAVAPVPSGGTLVSGVMPASTGGAFFVSSIGGYQGSTFVAHESGDVYEYSEDVAVAFNKPVQFSTFRYSIAPAAPNADYQLQYGTPPGIEFRKLPGIVYTITIPAGVKAADGSVLAAPFVFTLTTAAVPAIAAPLRSTKGESYRYGVREQPAAVDGSGGDAEIALDQQAGARFLRMDFCGATIEPNRGSFDWSQVDRILDKLGARGMTVLPIVDQYCSPPWANGNAPYPYIWERPADYASFAGAIAAHLTSRYAGVTRLELFNEPNGSGFWMNRNASYAATDGSATAPYMSAAYAAVKSAAPQLIVVGPALDGGSAASQFLSNLYAHGCRTGECWDVLSVHNYGWRNPAFQVASSSVNQWNVYQQLQQIATEHGDATPHVMLTEWGFSTYNSVDGFDPAVQAQYVAIGFNLMLADPTIDGIVYVNVYSPAQDFWGRTSLTAVNHSLLPAYQIYKRFAQY